MNSLIREPLLHFLVLAVVLFVVHDAMSHGTGVDDPRTIVVDRDELLTFIQYRTKAFDQEAAAAYLDSMTPESIEKVTQDYIREEALAREARELGLDENDYVIKRRLIQKLDYIARGFTDSLFEVTEEDIRQYFEENREDFYIQPRITFTHVFFNAKERGEETAVQLANETLQSLRGENVAFENAGRYGERFLYGLNFVERSQPLIASEFGEELTDKLFALKPSRQNWQGPFLSRHGAHLVMVTDVENGRYPSLEDVRVQVEQQATRAISDARTLEATQQIVDSYNAEILYPPQVASN